ncbi:hypothetical protein KR074_003273 [Drosophila pseudoananassae]|nr:hypothetical protein KR074_003273 [Drosophila pseudoananassae]
MDSTEEEGSVEMARVTAGAGQPTRTFEDLMALTNNSERLMASVNSNLDALNGALDRLEERTERVLLELRHLINSEDQESHDGCGDHNSMA